MFSVLVSVIVCAGRSIGFIQCDVQLSSVVAIGANVLVHVERPKSDKSIISVIDYAWKCAFPCWRLEVRVGRMWLPQLCKERILFTLRGKSCASSFNCRLYWRSQHSSIHDKYELNVLDTLSPSLGISRLVNIHFQPISTLASVSCSPSTVE